MKISANMKQKSIKVPGKILVAHKSEGEVRRTLHTPKKTTFNLFY